MTLPSHPTVSILGVGGIGLPIARLWSRAGHRLVLGSRTPDRLRSGIESLGITADIVTPSEAARRADIALLAVPYPALAELAEAVATDLDGTIVIDATNPMGLADDGRIISTLDDGRASGVHTAELLPSSTVVRAFSHVMEELLWPRGTGQSKFWGMAVAGDDYNAKAVTSGLISDAGFEPVDIGTLAESSPLDPGGALFPNMFTPEDLRITAGVSIPVAVGR
ncbi:NADPH-dependent F420 reductase [Rhodococcus sovatensis]|uniref:NAD(P)-binding domain-containing protein n=1 Tax=Rhodococcus sovatensis TaxID=1805840 RepID=A0ABZ2PMY7_9NOCA